MKPAVAIITYLRDRYFELTLSSILSQRIDGHVVDEVFDLYVFQDGLAAHATPEERRSHSEISRIVESVGRRVQFIKQERNLGIALHFDFIEKFVFLDKGHDFSGFFEDDLILSPGHMKAFKLLQEKFQDDERVGMVSAVPATYRKSLQDQLASLHDYEHMGHSWAFGLSRQFWRRRQPFVDEYLNFVKGIPYAKRPHKDIYDWLNSKGMQPKASSQDYIKQCATAALGAVRIATSPNYGFYIGRVGEHCTPEFYEKSKFEESILCTKGLDRVADLSDEKFNRIYQEQKATFFLDKSNLPVTTDDVKAAYRMFFGRDAESSSVIDEKLNRTRQQILRDFILSDEFLGSSVSRQLIAEAYNKAFGK
ncbi:hypothetical protein [Burkholderia pseudomultivorans]|uniref:hypothetical protein n=1 Tax=Burkholderia pseudomultivorans TaxID=1207504 RepID=UPI000ABA8B6E|nr:hypothetical protein [Burkholderia pseudomultivorans]